MTVWNAGTNSYQNNHQTNQAPALQNERRVKGVIDLQCPPRTASRRREPERDEQGKEARQHSGALSKETLNLEISQMFALNVIPPPLNGSTLSPLNPQPSTLNPEPSTLNPETLTPDP